MIEVCKEYKDIIELMNKYDEEDKHWTSAVDDFHYHISTCTVCKNQVFYDHGTWKFNTAEECNCGCGCVNTSGEEFIACAHCGHKFNPDWSQEHPKNHYVCPICDEAT